MNKKVMWNWKLTGSRWGFGDGKNRWENGILPPCPVEAEIIEGSNNRVYHPNFIGWGNMDKYGDHCYGIKKDEFFEIKHLEPLKMKKVVIRSDYKDDLLL